MTRSDFLTAVVAATLLGMASAAQAEGGCGGGWHRGPHGNCRPNYGGYGPAVVPVVPAYGPGYGPVYGPAYAPAFVPEVGVFYPGRGYWDGNRYYYHRRHWGGGWRYW
jgi:hypothetical protein